VGALVAKKARILCEVNPKFATSSAFSMLHAMLIPRVGEGNRLITLGSTPIHDVISSPEACGLCFFAFQRHN
jgi:hypothetical protein